MTRPGARLELSPTRAAARRADRAMDQAAVLVGDRVGSALAGIRLGGALRCNDILRQAILNLALRVGIEPD